MSSTLPRLSPVAQYIQDSYFTCSSPEGHDFEDMAFEISSLDLPIPRRPESHLGAEYRDRLNADRSMVHRDRGVWAPRLTLVYGCGYCGQVRKYTRDLRDLEVES